MKIYLSIVGIFSILVLVKCTSPAVLKKRLKECGEEIGLNPESYDGAESALDEPRFKCFYACIMRKADAMENGKIVKEQAVAVAKEEHPNGVTESLKANIRECAKKANNARGGECEVAAAFRKCFSDKLPTPR